MGSIAASVLVVLPRLFYDLAVALGAQATTGDATALSLVLLAVGVATAAFTVGAAEGRTT